MLIEHVLVLHDARMLDAVSLLVEMATVETTTPSIENFTFVRSASIPNKCGRPSEFIAVVTSDEPPAAFMKQDIFVVDTELSM